MRNVMTVCLNQLNENKPKRKEKSESGQKEKGKLLINRVLLYLRIQNSDLDCMKYKYLRPFNVKGGKLICY
jgi:hypothetical protein